MELSDAPETLKEELRKFALNKKQGELQIKNIEAQSKQLENMQSMQNIAQTEAEQTTPPMEIQTGYGQPNEIPFQDEYQQAAGAVY
jgi:hypothetical protein